VGKRASHPPGTLSWVHLATTDVGAAKAFYGRLFGWETEDNDAADGTTYTTCRVGGDAVCGLIAMPDEMRAAGVPPNWTSYVTVVDADEAAARTRDLGGDVVTDPFDVPDAGRTAVLRDPQGAVFAVWQPGASIGAERVNDVGCLTNNELATTDLDAARSFYEDLFGWTTEDVDTGPNGPAMVAALNGGRLNANLTTVVGDVPPHWRPYFTVESTDATVKLVRELGGQVLLEPLTIPPGSIAMVLDPQGALFALFEGEVDD
jgi:uncharacterized protein